MSTLITLYNYLPIHQLFPTLPVLIHNFWITKLISKFQLKSEIQPILISNSFQIQRNTWNLIKIFFFFFVVKIKQFIYWILSSSKKLHFDYTTYCIHLPHCIQKETWVLECFCLVIVVVVVVVLVVVIDVLCFLSLIH